MASGAGLPQVSEHSCRRGLFLKLTIIQQASTDDLIRFHGHVSVRVLAHVWRLVLIDIPGSLACCGFGRQDSVVVDVVLIILNKLLLSKGVRAPIATNISASLLSDATTEDVLLILSIQCCSHL